MVTKWIGGVCIFVSCAAAGFSLAMKHQSEIKGLQVLVRILEEMLCELEYRLTPLPELCRLVSHCTDHVVCKVFHDLADELDGQILPDASHCMEFCVSKLNSITPRVKNHLSDLGEQLGKYDLCGQVNAIQSVINNCKKDLCDLEAHKDERLRSYKTLGLCAGAALVIIFI